MTDHEKTASKIAANTCWLAESDQEYAPLVSAIAAALDEAVEAERERCIRHITALRCDHDAGSDGDEALGSAIKAIRGEANE